VAVEQAAILLVVVLVAQGVVVLEELQMEQAELLEL
jgi:hypothetical protein